LPRSLGSAWTTTSHPITECGPERGICKHITNVNYIQRFKDNEIQSGGVYKTYAKIHARGSSYIFVRD